MNQEIADFFVKFTSQGITEIRRDLEAVRQEVQNVAKSFDESGRSGDKFFNSFDGWIKKVAALGTAFFSLRAVIRGAFDTANDTIELYQAADKAQVSPQRLEQFARSLEYVRGTPIGSGTQDAAGLFGAINKILLDYSNGNVSEEVAKKTALAGLPMFVPQGKTLEEQQQSAIDYFTRAAGATYGKDLRFEDLLAAHDLEGYSTFFELGQGGQKDVLDIGRARSYITTVDDALQKSLDLIHRQQEYQIAWQKFYQEFQPFITMFLQYVATPLVEWLAGLMKQYGPEIQAWIKELLPQIQDFFIRVFKTLGALVKYFNGEAKWQDVKDAWEGIERDENGNPLNAKARQAEFEAELKKAQDRPLMAAVLAGGAAGALGGSTIPVIGTTAGAVIGGVAGAWGGIKAGDVAVKDLYAEAARYPLAYSDFSDAALDFAATSMGIDPETFKNFYKERQAADIALYSQARGANLEFKADINVPLTATNVRETARGITAEIAESLPLTTTSTE